MIGTWLAQKELLPHAAANSLRLVSLLASCVAVSVIFVNHTAEVLVNPFAPEVPTINMFVIAILINAVYM